MHKFVKKSLVTTAMFLVTAGAALAQPTAKFNGRVTTVTLSSQFVEALGALELQAAAVRPAVLRQGVARFPIPAAEVDLAAATGEILHTGGLRLSSADTVVELTMFIIDLTDSSAPVLTGLAKVDDAVVARLPLFKVELPTLDLPLAGGQRLVVPGVGLKLTEVAAQTLNTVFGVDALVEDFPIGTAAVRLVRGRP